MKNKLKLLVALLSALGVMGITSACALTGPTSSVGDDPVSVSGSVDETSEESSSPEESSAPETVTYTVKFVNEDDSVLSETKYEEGAEVVEPETPTKAADKAYTYEFAGWDKTVTAVSGDVTYKATYNKTAIEYTLSFNHPRTGMLLAAPITFTVETMDEIVFPEVPEEQKMEGYTVAWDKTKEDVELSDIMVVPVWTPIEYTITFKNGEDVVETVAFNAESTDKQAPAIPEKTGYTGAWSAYDFTKLENQTASVSYTANKYMITYDVNGGSISDASLEVTYDDSYVLSKATPAKLYQEFLGWQDAKGNTVAMEGDWTVASDVTLKAVYSKGVTFETLESVPTYMTASGTTASMSIVEMTTTDGNKALEIKSTNTADGGASSAPAMKVTLDFLASFFADESVDYIAFDAKSGATTTGNFRRVTIRANGSFSADPYEEDNGFNGIRPDAWKTFYFSRTDYNNWIDKKVTAESFIATGNFTSGDSIYVDNIRPATAAERKAGIYSFESGGLRVNDGGQTLLFYTLETGWHVNIQVESGKAFSNSGYTNEKVTDGVRAVQFTKEAGSFQINFPSDKNSYKDIVTATGYYAVDIYVPEGSDATIAYQFTTYPGITPKKGGWTTVYVFNSFNVLKVTDTTGGTYVIDNIRSISEEEYYLAALGFEASGSGLRTHELDETANSSPSYYYAGADHKANTYSIAIVEGNGENDVSAIKNVSYSSEVVHGGAYSLCIEKGTGYMYMAMRTDSMANSLLKNGFTFWIYSTTELDGVNTDNFINGDNAKFNGGAGVTVKANTWTQITVTAEDMRGAARFLIIQGGGATAGTIYIDDICPLTDEN